MAQTKAPEKKADWLVPTAIVVGGVGIAAGLYLYLKKPMGIDPGGSFNVTFKFNYLGDGGTYILQVHLGRLYIGGIFDHVKGLSWSKSVVLPGPDSYEFSFKCDLPMATTPESYDGEAGIRVEGAWDPPYNYIGGPVYKEGAVQVREST